jgi:hypothetical protein
MPMARESLLAPLDLDVFRLAMPAWSAEGERFDVMVHSLVDSANGINIPKPAAIRNRRKE